MKVIPFPGQGHSAAGTRPGRRLTLPVAPRCNFRKRFESTASSLQAMTPVEALALVDEAVGRGTPPAIVELAGPGDPLALPAPALETLRLVRRKYPELGLSLTTLGMGGAEHAYELAEIGIDRIVLQVDAVSPAIGEKVYLWIRPGTRTVPLWKAVDLLLAEQAHAIRAFRQAGVKVRISTTVYPGVNDGQIEEIAACMAALGATEMCVNPASPPADSANPAVRAEIPFCAIRAGAAKHLKIVDTEEAAGEETGPVPAAGPVLPKPSKERPNVAVVSSNGVEVDLHLGQAIKVMVYGPREDGLPCLLDVRFAPEPGSGPSRWEELAATLPDCFALLTSSAGQSPRQVLAGRGITVLITEENIDGAVDVLYGGGKKKKRK